VKVVSVNVGLPREVPWRGKLVTTGIFKEPVAGRVALRGHNLEGDRQADPSVHGGPDKAVYAYPSEHYPHWCGVLGVTSLPWGALGENLTTEGWLEDAVCIGDRFCAGSAELEVSQPRQPCFKLGLRHGRPDLPKRFLHSGRSGFYLRVVRAGDVGAGDALERIRRDERQLPVAALASLAGGRGDAALARRARDHPALAAAWKESLRDRSR